MVDWAWKGLGDMRCFDVPFGGFTVVWRALIYIAYLHGLDYVGWRKTFIPWALGNRRTESSEQGIGIGQ